MEPKYKRGDKVIVNHCIGDRFVDVLGYGVITNIDATTYSIAIYTIKLTNGRFAGESFPKIEHELKLDN